MADDLVSILLKFISETDAAQKDVSDLDKRLKEVNASAQQVNEKFENMAQVSARVAAAGATIFAPALLSAQAYVNALGKTEEVSKRYIAAQERQKEATLAFGKKAAEALIPYQNALADILELFSRIDPRILEAGIAAGGGLVLVGAIGTLVAQIGIFTAQSTRLIASLNANFAAGGMTSRAAVGIGAIGVGTGLGIGATRAIGEATGDERLQTFELKDALKTFIQIVTIAAGTLGDLAKIVPLVEFAFKTGSAEVKAALGDLVDGFKNAVIGLQESLAGIKFEILGKEFNLGKELGIDPRQLEEQRAAIEASKQARQEEKQAAKDFAAIQLGNQIDDIDEATGKLQLKMLDLVESLDKTSESAATTARTFGEDSLDLFAKYRDEQKAAETQFNEDRVAKQKQFEADFKAAETQFNDSRVKALKAFNDNQKQAERDFKRQQAADLKKFQADQQKEARGFDSEQRQQEKEHQTENIKRIKEFGLERQRAEEDSRRSLIEAAGRLDAIAVLRELQSQETNRKRATEDFDSESTERQQAFEENRRLAREQFQQNQADRRREFEENRAAAQAQFQERQGLERQRFNEQRQLQLEEFRQSQTLRRQAFTTALSEEQSKYNRERQMRQAAFRDALDQLNGWGRYEVSARQRYYEQLRRDLDRFLRTVTAAPPRVSTGSRGNFRGAVFAEGGYTGQGGLAYTDPGEFVNTAATTRAMERFAGAPLTQEKIMNAITNNNRTMGNVSINITGGGNPQDTALIVRRELIKAFQEMS